MGKKQRRNQSRKAVAQAPVVAATAPITPEPEPLPARVQPPRQVATAAKARPGTTWAEFADKYRYVNIELKQIGILAGSFLVVLLILAAILG